MNPRESLRQTFDSAASQYQTARPDYPPELFDDLLAMARLTPPAALLEIGCGPGKATIPLARHGFAITALELGPHLAAAAEANLRDHDNVEVINASFEDWRPPEGARFDLVYAATAWSWVDPDVKYVKTAKLLRPRGHLAVWDAVHAFPPDFDPFFADVQRVYDEIGESHPGEWPPPPPEAVADESPGMEGSGLFDVVAVRRYLWAVDYDADSYLALLDTFSGHIAMEPAKRDYLYSEIRRLIAARPTNVIRRHWLAVLTIGRPRVRTAQ